MRFPPRSIRGKAVLGSGIAIAVFGAVLGVGAYVVVTQAAVTSATGELESQLGEVSDQLSEQAAADPEGVDLEALQAAAPVYIQVVAADGTVQAASPGLAPTDRVCPDTVAAMAGAERVPLDLAGVRGGFLRATTTVDTASGPVAVCAATSDAPIERAQETVLLTLLIALPLLVISVCVVVWQAVGRALHAVDDMTSQAEAMQSTADGELRVRETHDEVEHLGRTLNALLARLHHQSRATRQFVADAGHELRNPLSTLRVTLEFGEDADEDGLRASVQNALADLDRLEELVQDLLVLARTDAMEVVADTEEIDLAPLIDDAVRSSQRGRPDLAFTSDLTPCRIHGNGLALRSLVANLLDNAARHAQTSVSVRLQANGRQAVLNVDDDGQGLRPEDCERVFERFVRLDESRDRDEGGSGLGLAIVAAIASSHAGAVHATPGPGGHFVVTLPIA